MTQPTRAFPSLLCANKSSVVSATRKRYHPPSTIYHLRSTIYASCFLCLVSCVLYLGCGSDPEEERVLTPQEYVQNGWREYASRNYEAAMLAFEDALAAGSDVPTEISVDGSYLADAYNGLGWVYLSLSPRAAVNQKNISTALDKFREAIARDSLNADAWVGHAVGFFIKRSSSDDLRDALKAVDDAFQGNVAYLYRHDYDSRADLYALRAQCYYYLGEPDNVRDEVNRALAIEEDNGAALAM